MTDNSWQCECRENGKCKSNPPELRKCPKCAFTPDTEYYPREEEKK